jgi:hypothetical protein
MPSEALHHTTISLDVQGSSSRTNPEKLVMRKVLYAAIEAAARFAGLGYSGWHLEDRGDGLLAIVPARVPKSRLLGPWVQGLYQALHAGDEEASGPAAVQLRAGFHAGEVHHDRYGVVGADVDIACRLADATIAKRTLAATPAAPLVVVVSDTIYQSVVRHRGQFLEPDHYRQVSVTVKDLSLPAWLYVPGYEVPPLPSDPEPDEPRAAQPAIPGPPMIGSTFGPATVLEAAITHHLQLDQIYRDFRDHR